MFKKFIFRRKTRFVLKKNFNFFVDDKSREDFYKIIDEALEESENEYDAAIKFLLRISFDRPSLIEKDFEVFILRLSSNIDRVLIYTVGDKEKILKVLTKQP